MVLVIWKVYAKAGIVGKAHALILVIRKKYTLTLSD